MSKGVPGELSCSLYDYFRSDCLIQTREKSSDNTAPYHDRNVVSVFIKIRGIMENDLKYITECYPQFSKRKSNTSC